MDRIALITPTGDRPECIALAARWVERIKVPSGVETAWIIADDSTLPSRLAFRPGVLISHQVYPGDPLSSFKGNLLAGLTLAEEWRADALLVIEDDDWYSADYLRSMVGHLRRKEVVGDGGAVYYHLPSGRSKVHHNTDRASLSSTAMRSSFFPVFHRVIEEARTPFLDITLWSEAMRLGMGQVLVPKVPRVVGMKGLPGRAGLGNGHHPDGDGWVRGTLRAIIGDDEEVYRAYCG